jgi:hypothetical protein
MSMKMICSSCGTVCYPVKITKGSILIELFLWLCFLFPGLIYSIWRLTSRYNACPCCKSSEIIPLNSPKGLKLVEKYHYEIFLKL